MPETRIPKQVINWKLSGRGKPGRPRSWQEDIDNIMQEDDMSRDGKNGELASEDVLHYEPINKLIN